MATISTVHALMGRLAVAFYRRLHERAVKLLLLLTGHVEALDQQDHHKLVGGIDPHDGPAGSTVPEAADARTFGGAFFHEPAQAIAFLGIHQNVTGLDGTHLLD